MRPKTATGTYGPSSKQSRFCSTLRSGGQWPTAFTTESSILSPNVWELKTEDVRLFGWFPQRAHFIAVCGSLKNAIRKARDYAPFIQKVIDFRTALELDEPKAITGVGHDDVL